LATIDLANCSGLTNLDNAFYGCASLKAVNIATANGITKTYSAFDGCSSLESITLPATITLGKFMFGSCSALTTIDWSAYSEVEAPAMPANFFQYVDNVEGITLKVPAAAYESFAANAKWAKFNLQAATVTAIGGVKAAQSLKVVYDINGRHIGTFNNVNNLPKGLYIINGKKVMK
jgi:hypothetical protein